jgi:hypothetical protein
MFSITRKAIAVSILVAGMINAGAQTTPVSDLLAKAKSDSAKPVGAPKPFAEVITKKAVTDMGMFNVHKIDNKYYFEIGDTLLGREMLLVNRIARGPAGSKTYAGDDLGSRIVYFEKGPNNKIFLRLSSYATYAKDSASPMFTSVNNSNIAPIISAFDIKALSKDSAGSVIEVTDLVNSDNDVFNFTAGKKMNLFITALQSDKSYVKELRSFPMNVEIRTVKTYARTPNQLTVGLEAAFGIVVPQNSSLTVELNSSLVLLPREPMQPRYADPRVGFFDIGYTDFDVNPQGVQQIKMIKRWRLEPKPQDMEKYKRGELVEPQKQIIFYIDPATPKKWVPYLIQGINDWQKAFEHAGFKNAIVAKTAPTPQEDPEWSIDDSRYSAIVYKPSETPNASGPSISDPRSGEIMESHINWYHNVMSLIHDWYFIQCAPLDTAARKMVFSDELMGQLIRFVSSHEVGHTLGLMHNFGSSSTVPVEKLRDKNWVEANGHTPSIMDYARFNYVAQPEDHIGRAGLFPRIGDYDNWAIEWGYRCFPAITNSDEQKSYLNKWVIEKLKNKRLWYGTQKIGGLSDPRSQSEQVGDDAMKASSYGIKNLKRVMTGLPSWTATSGEDYESLFDMYNQLTLQFQRYIGHVTNYIGGTLETPKMSDEAGAVFVPVAKKEQQEAMQFLDQQLFKTPEWLIDEKIFGTAAKNNGFLGFQKLAATKVIGDLQNNALAALLDVNRLSNLLDAESATGDKTYTITDLFADLRKGIWSELRSKASVDIYRRNLQKSYLILADRLLNSTQTAAISNTDIRSVIRADLLGLLSQVKTAIAVAPDNMTRYHLQDIVYRIEESLHIKK